MKGILTNTSLLLVATMSLVISSCVQTKPSSPTEDKTALSLISAETAGKGPLGDTPASQLYREIEEAFKAMSHNNLGFSIYRLVPPGKDVIGHLKERSELIGIRGGTLFYPDDNVDPREVSADKSGIPVIGLRAGDFELSYNRDSGSELYVNTERFHNHPGVHPDKLMPESRYIENARQYVEKLFSSTMGGGVIYPYKVRRYMDATAKLKEKPVVSTSQVSVAFNASIDGIPVIGPGSKLVVHMDPEGHVVAHESTQRLLGAKISSIAGTALHSPASAQKMVEARIRERGIRLEEYTLSRKEFGYLRLGRNSIQDILSPYYAYIYEPRSPKVLGRKIVEITSAVSDPKLSMLIDEDMIKDQQRKDAIITRAGRDDIRRDIRRQPARTQPTE